MPKNTVLRKKVNPHRVRKTSAYFSFLRKSVNFVQFAPAHRRTVVIVTIAQQGAKKSVVST
ncbi:MAG: hypothetical protein CMR00_00575 [[Chlorobium] sp. 445]|nr:MAG: hypothetical protein CMR00_00575 [[Chlorobium] sp. 445]